MVNKILTESYNINDKNYLCINNINLVDIVQQYGTPTIVYGKNRIINQISDFKQLWKKKCKLQY